MESEDSETDWGKSLQFYMMIHDSHLTPSQGREKKTTLGATQPLVSMSKHFKSHHLV